MKFFLFYFVSKFFVFFYYSNIHPPNLNKRIDFLITIMKKKAKKLKKNAGVTKCHHQNRMESTFWSLSFSFINLILIINYCRMSQKFFSLNRMFWEENYLKQVLCVLCSFPSLFYSREFEYKGRCFGHLLRVSICLQVQCKRFFNKNMLINVRFWSRMQNKIEELGKVLKGLKGIIVFQFFIKIQN